MTVRDQVHRFVVGHFYVSDASTVTDDVSLIDSGIVDSTGMLEVIMFLETEFGIRVLDRETVPENLETIARIASYVERKRAEAG